MRAVFSKEWHSYFRSLRTYIFLTAVLLVSGIYFSQSILTPEDVSYTDAFLNICTMMIPLIPLLTMRSFSFERAYKTDRILLTGYINGFSVILGKLLAAFCVFWVAGTLAFFYPAFVTLFSDVSFFEILLLYIGLLLFGMAVLSFGLFVSSLSHHPVRAYFVTITGLLVFWMTGNILPNIENSTLRSMFFAISLFVHLECFTNGFLGFASVVYMLSFGLVFLIFSTKIINLWRGKRT